MRLHVFFVVLSVGTLALADDGGWDLPTLPPPVPDGGVAQKEGKPPLKIEKMPFSQESIRAVMNYHQDEIQGCYEKTLADKDKIIEGKLMTAFIITKDGGVREVKVLKRGTTLKEPKLHDCVVGVLSELRFPKPHDRREHPIEYPFNLKTIR